MQTWLWRSAASKLPSRLATCIPRHSRLFTTHTHDEVHVRCGSAGFVTVDLINLNHHSPSAPLFVYFPPVPPRPTEHIPLPDVLQPWPVAVIRYRWSNTQDDTNSQVSLRWPTPVHDTGFAFSWLQEALAPDSLKRRDIYVYGSHLGASLATSLGLTEAHAHAKFGVRGVIAYNGVYNWTMFLPDHRINKATSKTKKPSLPPPRPPEGSHLYNLQESLPDLFATPGQMFDPFASPSLFFHGPGLLIPKSFIISSDDAADLNTLLSGQYAMRMKAPRRSHLVFPPRKSTLKIPNTLLLHDTPNLVTEKLAKRSVRRGNSFETQAEELAEMMRRSVDKVELKMRSQWDLEMDGLEDEAERRVRIVDVGEEKPGWEMGDVAEKVVRDWLDEKLPS
ncbi:hypothetical protein NLU13_7222 [Sarocladium strictum]|uniref:Alpha/beta hydrolase fold-3 domain-containing protein n=1 Tax=Sarocladium strictum TaxID=5046 RepID=A0AA39GDW8_SARSR|nr:hypothetical protein NLU13_7222 [Sarocladium strictum]